MRSRHMNASRAGPTKNSPCQRPRKSSMGLGNTARAARSVISSQRSSRCFARFASSRGLSSPPRASVASWAARSAPGGWPGSRSAAGRNSPCRTSTPAMKPLRCLRCSAANGSSFIMRPLGRRIRRGRCDGGARRRTPPRRDRGRRAHQRCRPQGLHRRRARGAARADGRCRSRRRAGGSSRPAGERSRRPTRRRSPRP